MHAVRRPFVTTGVALAGAGAIALSSVTAPPTVTPPPVVHEAVHLLAAPSPVALYSEVTRHALENAAEVVSAYLSYPVRSAVGAVVAGTVALPITAVIAASAVVNGIGAAVVAAGDVLAALVSLDLADLVHAVLDIPARLADGVLNGGYSAGVLDAGLLTADAPLGERLPGLFIWPAYLGLLLPVRSAAAPAGATESVADTTAPEPAAKPAAEAPQASAPEPEVPQESSPEPTDDAPADSTDASAADLDTTDATEDSTTSPTSSTSSPRDAEQEPATDDAKPPSDTAEASGTGPDQEPAHESRGATAADGDDAAA